MAEVTNKHFDRRVVDRYIEKKTITPEQYKAHLKGLPDDTENGTWVQMDIHDTELGEGDHADSGDDDEEGA